MSTMIRSGGRPTTLYQRVTRATEGLERCRGTPPVPKRIHSLAKWSACFVAALSIAPATAIARYRAHAPSVTTGSASGVGSSSATVNGTVNPNHSSTTYRFQYGTSSAYGSSTANVTIPSGTSAVSARAAVSSLAASTTYHYRLTASNAMGTAHGSDAVFTTSASAAPTDTSAPTAPGSLVGSAGDAQVSLSWSASSDNVGVAGYRVFRDGLQVAQSSATSFTDSGLANGTSYSYYVVAFDAAGNVSAASNTVSATPAATTSPSSSYDSTVLTDHPVAFWDMRNPGGSEMDLSGNGHSGSYKGGTPALTTMPNGDKAVDFNGSTEYMTVLSSSAFSISTTQELTWEGWIRPAVLQWSSVSDPYGYGYVDWMGKCQDYSPSCEWESRVYATVNSDSRCNRLSAYVFNPSAGLGADADWQPNCNLLQAGQWLHVVGEYQTQTTPSSCKSAYPGTINVWVNGVPWNPSYHYPTGCMSQYSITPKAGSSPLDIGTMAMDTWFPGAVGKVAIYNYLLTQSQITAHFRAMTGGAPSGSCANTCSIPVPTP